jgi:hypothetical protein
MKKLTIEFEISDEAFKFLHSITGNIEYRDYNCETQDEFLESNDYKSEFKTLPQFLSRNAGGTLKLARELDAHGLLEDVEDSWHTTFQVSEKGKEVIRRFPLL